MNTRSGRNRCWVNKMVSIDIARKIMGNGIIGPDELQKAKNLGLMVPEITPSIMFSPDELEQKKDDYLLVLGLSRFINGESVTIRNLLGIFGKDPEISEPCFYNQDWYVNERFIDIPMADGWFFIRKKVYETSRAVQPVELMKKYQFPLAVTCVYSFFVAWLALGEKLWLHDFVWCDDTDHNGDRIYVGKYNDVDGINKNGFSIHRHLALRDCYACID